MTNVLHVYRTYFPETQGGLEETIRQICLGTHELGVRSRVLSLGPKAYCTKIDEAEVTFKRLNFEIASCGVGITALYEHYRLVEWADVINYHFPWPYADVLYFAGNHFRGKNRCPTVITYHSDIVRQRALSTLYRPLMTRFLRAADRIVCTSPNYFATSDALIRHEESVEVIPIGIDESSYPTLTDATLTQCKERFGTDFFLFIGVLRYYKGLHILLEAMKDTELKVVIAGSGPIEGELKKQAKATGLTNVSFAGYVTDQEKMALLELSRAIVFPSYLRAEAFGVTLLEGAMHGKPLVSTEVGSGTSHVNIDEQTGIVVEPGNPDALRKAMQRLNDDDELAARMGANARDRYERMFTGRLMSERYQLLYQKLLPNQPESSSSEVEKA